MTRPTPPGAGIASASRPGPVVSADLAVLSGCHDLARRLTVRVDRSRRLVASGDVTVAFGGHFSAGKSTLINAMTGRSLLPTGDLPETGVPCHLRPGTADRAVKITGDRISDLRCDTTAIADEVTLLDGRGAYRETVHDVTRVDLTLGGDALPLGAVWIDSPGIDDQRAMTDRAWAAIEPADLLVWVVNSRQPLGDVEQDFLTKHLAERSALGVVFVVNAFLEEDTERAWERFQQRSAPAIRDRIHDYVGDLLASWSGAAGSLQVPVDHRPPVLFTSARAFHERSGGFGGTAVRDLLRGLTPNSPRVHAARLGRVAFLLGTGLGDIDEQMRRAAERWAEEIVQREQCRRELATQREGFERALRAAVLTTFTEHRPAAAECAIAVAATADTGALSRDNAYGRDLTARLSGVADRIADQLVTDTERCAARRGMGQPDSGLRHRLRNVLRPATLTVTVPRNAPVGRGRGGLAAGAAIGGVLGSLVMPGVGTALGGLLGGGVGGAVSDDGVATALAKDRLGVKAAVHSASDTAVTAMMGRRPEVERLLLAACTTPALPGAADAESQVAALAQVHRSFAESYVLPACLAAEQAWRGVHP